jgi:hypothetical protein
MHLSHRLCWNRLFEAFTEKRGRPRSNHTFYPDRDATESFVHLLNSSIDEFASTVRGGEAEGGDDTYSDDDVIDVREIVGVDNLTTMEIDHIVYRVTTVKMFKDQYGDASTADILKILINHDKLDIVEKLIRSGVDISGYYYGGYSNFFNGGLEHLLEYADRYILLNMIYLLDATPGREFDKDQIRCTVVRESLNNIMKYIGENHDYRSNVCSKMYRDFMKRWCDKTATFDDLREMCKYYFKTLYVLKYLDNYNRKFHRMPLEKLPPAAHGFLLWRLASPEEKERMSSVPKL